VVFEPPGVAVEQQRRSAGGLDLLVHGELARDETAGQPVLLTVE
jgi:hypothetical protein